MLSNFRIFSMGVTIDRVDRSEEFEITCSDCGETFTVPAVHEVLRWLPLHLFRGHEVLSEEANRSASKGSSDTGKGDGAQT